MCLFYKVSQDVSVTLAKLGYHPGYHHPFLYLDTRYTFVRFGLPYSNTRGYGAIYMLWCEYNKCKSPLEFSMFSAGVDYHARAAGRGKLRGKQQLRERNNNWGKQQEKNNWWRGEKGHRHYIYERDQHSANDMSTHKQGHCPSAARVNDVVSESTS